MTLELVETEILDSGLDEDMVVHMYCEICYPVMDQEISYCGMDLSNEPVVETVADSDYCAMCVVVLDSWPERGGAKVCPKGHVQ